MCYNFAGDIMKIVGVICEFNPYHNGHDYFLKEVRKKSKADVLIVCLSSYFTMRGDLSIHNPFLKTEYTLNNADIVVSLPSFLAVNSADYFSYYAVRELNKLKVSDIYFGTENSDLSIYETYNLSFNELNVKDNLKTGISYKKLTSEQAPLKPNELLGYCYYKAIKKINKNINIHTIKRENSTHGSLIPSSDTICSSSAIRNNLSLFDNYTPSYVSKEVYDYEKLFNYFKSYIILNKNNYANLRDVTEGIENLIIKNIYTSSSFNELITKSTTKRYTSSKIKRTIFRMMFSVTYEDDYIYSRILGFNNTGKKYLNLIKKDITLLTQIKPNISNILDTELKIARILDLIYNDNNYKNEISKPIIKDRK